MPKPFPLPEPEVVRAQLGTPVDVIRKTEAYKRGFNAAAVGGNYNTYFHSASYTQQFRLGFVEYCEQHKCIGWTLFDVELTEGKSK